mgnify:CR=1 FL=1
MLRNITDNHIFNINLICFSFPTFSFEFIEIILAICCIIYTLNNIFVLSQIDRFYINNLIIKLKCDSHFIIQIKMLYI